MVSDGGRRLQGLESLFLSCLQGVALAGNDRTALGVLQPGLTTKPVKTIGRLFLLIGEPISLPMFLRSRQKCFCAVAALQH